MNTKDSGERNHELVLVTGGSGFLGHNLCAHLLAHGYRVRSVDLLPFHDAHIRGVESVVGDVRNADVMARAAAGATHVVHCAAKRAGESDDVIHSVNVDGTRCVLEASRRAGVRRFVFMSTSMVYEKTANANPVSEDAALAAKASPFVKAMQAAEELCLRAGTSLELSILRPAVTLGRGRLGLFDLIFDWVKSRKNLPIIGRGDHRYQLLDAEDLAEAVRLCLVGDARKVSGIFNVGAEEFSTLRRDLEALLEHAGFGKRVVSLPEAWTKRLLRTLFRYDMSSLDGWIYEAASENSQLSVDALRRATSWRARKSNAQALIDSYDDYLVHADSLPESYGHGHRDRWKPGVLNAAKIFF